MDVIIWIYVQEKPYHLHGKIISREKGPYLTGTGFYDHEVGDGNCDEYSFYENSGLTESGHKYLGEKLGYEFEKILKDIN